MPEETFVSTQCRESAPYLRDVGYQVTAKLLLAAAAEIEMLHALVAQHAPKQDFARDLGRQLRTR